MRSKVMGYIRTVLVAAAAALAGALPIRATGITVPDGTPVHVRLAQVLSSEVSQPGDAVVFRVVTDVVVDGVVVIARDARAHGVVLEATRGQVRTPRAELLFTIRETVAIGGQTVRLRPTRDWSPEDGPAGYAPTRSATSLLLWAGQAHRFVAFVDGEQVLESRLPLAAAPPAAPAAPPAAQLGPPPVREPRPRAPEVMTNEEVIELVGAGLSEDVVIAAIEMSRQAFRLEAADIITLRQAGVSDRILLAMIDRALGVRPRM
jgi:hypothetical protein